MCTHHQHACAHSTLCARRELDDLEEMSERYRAVVEQNRALYNEVQDLKGSIRVFCRIRWGEGARRAESGRRCSGATTVAAGGHGAAATSAERGSVKELSSCQGSLNVHAVWLKDATAYLSAGTRAAAAAAAGRRARRATARAAAWTSTMRRTQSPSTTPQSELQMTCVESRPPPPCTVQPAATSCRSFAHPAQLQPTAPHLPTAQLAPLPSPHASCLAPPPLAGTSTRSSA